MTQTPLNQIDILDRKGYFSYPVRRYFKNREFENIDGKRCIDFCSTSYLHFDFEDELIEAGNDCVRQWGLTTQWSRLEAGAQIHPRLEEKIANFIELSILGIHYVAYNTTINRIVFCFRTGI